MQIPQLVSWAKEKKLESREKRQQYDVKRLPKIDAYVDMIIARGEYIQGSTIKMQRYMDEIQDALDKLTSYGVKTPFHQPKTKTSENPLRPN